MSDLGDYGETTVADLLFGTVLAGWTRPVAHDTVRIRLWTTMPDETRTGGVEVSGGAYAALDTANNDTNFSRTGSVASNAIALTWATATANWGTILGITIEDTSNNLIALKTLTTSKTINTDDTFEIAIGDLDITFA